MTARNFAKLTKQGVRDLGGTRPRRRRIAYVCPHVWELETDWDHYPEPIRYERCGFCGERR